MDEESSEFGNYWEGRPIPKSITLVHEPMFKLKLVVDKKKDKVVLAEAGKDFVDLLFRFMALPMSTIVRLHEKYHQYSTTPIGCFNNLYRSVRDMDKDDFLNEACKNMLLYPGTKKENRKRVSLNTDEALKKYYRCPNWSNFCFKVCSEQSSEVDGNVYVSSEVEVDGNYFFALRCSCGSTIIEEFEVLDDGCDEIFINGGDDIFVSEKTSFLITEDMKVEIASIALTKETLRRLGYKNLDNLTEKVVDVYHEEVILSLFHSLFSSKMSLTDAFMGKHSFFGMPRSPGFLEKHSSFRMEKSPNMPPTSPMQDGFETELSEVVSLTVFVRKQDRKVLYAESGQDFVDLLFILLTVPLESVWEISGGNIELGCVENFCKSMKSLRSTGGTDASSETRMLPWQFSLGKSPFGVCDDWIKFRDNEGSSQSTPCGSSGLVKKGVTYMISDDLTITAAHSYSTVSIMKKWKVDLDDIEEHVINIGETEAIGLVRASLMTSSALTTALESLLLKKLEE